MKVKIPDELLNRWKLIFGEELEEFLEAIHRPLKPSIRINTLKAEKEEVLHILKKRELEITEIPWFEKGYFIENISDEESIGNWWEHFAGIIYVQSADFMIPPVVLEISENNIVLDMCASPGSKTTQMADMMNNQGAIVANDVSIDRIKALTSNLERMGVVNTVVTMMDGIRFGKLMPEAFDRILVDAPCSAEGTIRKSYKAIHNWKPWAYKKLANIQKSLLISAYKALKPGGIIVYSTCTFSPEENEEVVSSLLERYPATLEEMKIPGIIVVQGFVEWNDKKFNKELKKSIRIYPHKNEVGGFFIAKIRKPENQ